MSDDKFTYMINETLFTKPWHRPTMSALTNMFMGRVRMSRALEWSRAQNQIF